MRAADQCRQHQVEVLTLGGRSLKDDDLEARMDGTRTVVVLQVRKSKTEGRLEEEDNQQVRIREGFSERQVVHRH